MLLVCFFGVLVGCGWVLGFGFGVGKVFLLVGEELRRVGFELC
jgi:hypothetical protein